ncbi:hypothetical protein BTM_3426 [Burkholderia thailandensis 34]|nr:hypothetical protein BTM_3426 [Burkholderia thailandensis 34]
MEVAGAIAARPAAAGRENSRGRKAGEKPRAKGGREKQRGKAARKGSEVRQGGGGRERPAALAAILCLGGKARRNPTKGAGSLDNAGRGCKHAASLNVSRL